MAQVQHAQSSAASTGHPDWTAAAVWIVAAAIVGFAVPAILSTWLQWPRNSFLIPHVIVVGAFLAVFAARERVSFSFLTRAWPFGIVGAIAFGYFVVQNVLSQPASAAPLGAELMWALVWLGLIYGIVDALFLNVFPVLAVRAAGVSDSSSGWGGLLVRGVVALIASIAITAAYHFGFAEYRSAALFAPVFGNAILTLSFLITRSPIAPIGAHVAMHIAGVLHGMETVAQLPPHY